jgi:hypothetical protein
MDMFKNLLILICMMALVDFVWIENSWSFCDPHCEYEKTKKKKEEAEKKAKELAEREKKAAAAKVAAAKKAAAKKLTAFVSSHITPAQDHYNAASNALDSLSGLIKMERTSKCLTKDAAQYAVAQKDAKAKMTHLKDKESSFSTAEKNLGTQLTTLLKKFKASKPGTMPVCTFYGDAQGLLASANTFLDDVSKFLPGAISQLKTWKSEVDAFKTNCCDSHTYQAVEDAQTLSAKLAAMAPYEKDLRNFKNDSSKIASLIRKKALSKVNDLLSDMDDLKKRVPETQVKNAATGVAATGKTIAEVCDSKGLAHIEDNAVSKGLALVEKTQNKSVPAGHKKVNGYETKMTGMIDTFNKRMKKSFDLPCAFQIGCQKFKGLPACEGLISPE